MYKIYRFNNYFVIVDSKGTYFEEQCENVLVTKLKEGDQTYSISFLRQETLRGGTSLSQSFPKINFSDILDESGSPYASVTDWEEFYTKNTGTGYSLTYLTATEETATTSDITGLAATTSGTLKSITFVNIAGTLIIDGESFPEGTYSFNNPNGTLKGISYDATGSTNCKILTQK